MECINKGFCQINSSSTISSSSYKFNPTKYNKAEEQNENITHIFGREELTENYLESVTFQNRNLVLLKRHKTLLRNDHESQVNSVKILSGGAAIADPLFSGSIGSGMLTGAVFGELKKSPPSLTILEVLRFLSHSSKRGILVIVLNNLANRLNFGAACQHAAREGIKTLLVNVGEDVSGVSVSKTIGRKGLCGIKFLFKIAGAMSEEKKTIYEIHHVIEKLKGNSLGTINIQIRPDMMVIGPGTKGESEKLFFLWNTFDDFGENARMLFIVRQALSHLFHPSSYFSLHVVKGENIAVIVNNLGNLSDFYFNLFIKEVLDQVNVLGFKLVRLYCGRFFNSNSAGFSISVLKVKDNHMLELLDRPVNVTSWNDKSSVMLTKPNIIVELPPSPTARTVIADTNRGMGPLFTKQDATYLLDVLPVVIETIESMEEYLNKIDNDHDFGTAINKFSNAIKMEIQNKSLKISTPYEFLDQMAYLSGFTMGGVAGGIFSILFSSAAQVFLGTLPSASVTIGLWVEAARAARDGLQRFTRVRPGDGTILDALDPFVEYSIEHSVKGLSHRVSEAMRGAEATANSRTSSRKVSVKSTVEVVVGGEDQDGGVAEGEAMYFSVRTPDPGALCLAAVIRAVFTSLQIELAEAEALKARELRSKESLNDESYNQETEFNTDETEKESKDVAELVEKESKHSQNLIREVSKEVQKLKRENTQNDEELKSSDSKVKKQVGEAQKLVQHLSEHSDTLKDNRPNEIENLKEAFDEIADEVEREVRGEQN